MGRWVCPTSLSFPEWPLICYIFPITEAALEKPFWADSIVFKEHRLCSQIVPGSVPAEAPHFFFLSLSLLSVEYLPAWAVLRSTESSPLCLMCGELSTNSSLDDEHLGVHSGPTSFKYSSLLVAKKSKPKDVNWMGGFLSQALCISIFLWRTCYFYVRYTCP